MSTTKKKTNEKNGRYSRNGLSRGKTGSKARFSDTTRDEAKKEVKGTNDVSWYSTNKQLLVDAASIPYSAVLGNPLELFPELYDSSYNPNLLAKLQLPGVMALRVLPTYGVSEKETDPLTVAARAIYSFVRHANSGHTNYDAPDLMLYLLSMDQAYMMWSHLVRVYGIARTYNQKNRYYPRVIIEAMGFDFDDVMDNLANLRYRINMYAAQMSSFAVPTNMPIFKRHMWMYQHIFMDAKADKAQTYLYVPDAYYVFTETGVGDIPAPGTLIYTPFKIKYTVKEYCTEVMDAILNPLLSSEDMNIMSGDIRKAYGEKLYSFSEVPTDYTIYPEVDTEAMVQLHNATILSCTRHGEYEYKTPDYCDVTRCNITQNPNTGALLCKPYFKMMLPSFTNTHAINIFGFEPSPEITMVATRLVCDVEPEGNASQTDASMYTVTRCGTEVITNAWIFTFDEKGGYTVTPYIPNTGIYTESVTNPISDTTIKQRFANRNNLFYRGMLLSRYFDWAPSGLLVDGSVGEYTAGVLTSTGTDIFFGGDLNNFALLKPVMTDKVHTTALLSLYDIPDSLYR